MEISGKDVRGAALSYKSLWLWQWMTNAVILGPVSSAVLPGFESAPYVRRASQEGEQPSGEDSEDDV